MSLSFFNLFQKSTKKKGVRFADLTYDEDSSSESGDEQPKETIYEIEKEEVKPVVNNQTPKPKGIPRLWINF